MPPPRPLVGPQQQRPARLRHLLRRPLHQKPLRHTRPHSRELSVETEYADHGIGIAPGQNDRRPGYQRILELLHPDPQRLYPDSHPKHGQTGSPRLFTTTRCTNLIEQLRAASVKPEGKDALDIVDADWERQHGHAHAALRYLTLSRPGPSHKPDQPTDYATAYRTYDPDEARRERAQEMDQRQVREEPLWF